VSFQDIPGQPRAKRFLQQLVRNGRIPHALLLSGMAGIGKAGLAREFAKLVNCEHSADGDCCDACAACRKIDHGNHPDLIWLRPEGQFIKIEQIRALQARLRFRPFEGKSRVIVIEEAHQFREEAGNALLKLLEEPPQHNIFLLITLEPQMLLPTLVSRCCQVRVQPLPDAWIARHLTEDHRLPPEQAEQVARLALGSLKRARQLIESEQLTHQQQILQTVEDMGDMPMLDFFQRTAQWAKESKDLEQDLEVLQFWLRDLIILRLQGALPEPSPFSCSDRTWRAVTRTSRDCLFELYQQLDQALQRLRLNANKQLTLEGICLTIKDQLYGQGDWNSFSRGWQDLSF
jgi:DNA polymerase III subunit delta'